MAILILGLAIFPGMRSLVIASPELRSRAVQLGLAVYALFIGWTHQRLFGLPPLG